MTEAEFREEVRKQLVPVYFRAGVATIECLLDVSSVSISGGHESLEDVLSLIRPDAVANLFTQYVPSDKKTIDAIKATTLAQIETQRMNLWVALVKDKGLTHNEADKTLEAFDENFLPRD